jgi:hypothetical protein
MAHCAPSLTSLSQTIADYLDWHALRGSSSRHRGDIKRMLRRFDVAVGNDRSLDTVTREDCASFLRVIQEQGSKPNTHKAYHRVIER